MMALRSVAMAFACFSRIPMPKATWDDAGMRYMMAAFPLVGVIIGVLLHLWCQLAVTLGVGSLMLGSGITLIPVLVSGGIHMDGLADVIDAQSSYAPPEKRRQILKDPHVGAFAIIGVGCYLIAYLGLASEVDPVRTVGLACVPVVSRCVSGLATVVLRTSRQEGMLATEQRSSDAPKVTALLCIELALAGWCLLAHEGVTGLIALGAAGAVLAWVRHMAMRDFDGMSGDLAGFYLQMAELAMLACLVLVGRMV